MSDRDELLQRLDAEHQNLLQQVQTLTEEAAGRRPREGEWSAKEQLLHLVDREKMWLGWAIQARDNPGAEIGGPGPNPEGYPEAASRPLADILNELEATRRESMAAIETVTEEDLQKKAKTQAFGEMSVLQFLRALYRHDRMHAEQIAGKEPSFQPRFQQQS